MRDRAGADDPDGQRKPDRGARDGSSDGESRRQVGQQSAQRQRHTQPETGAHQHHQPGLQPSRLQLRGRHLDLGQGSGCRRVGRQPQAFRDVGQMCGGPLVHLGDHLVDAAPRVGLEHRQLAPGQTRRVLLQLGAHRGAAVAGEVRQLHPGLLGLAAQRDRALGLRQPSLPQDSAALLT
jgi:hypothetical protein